MAAQSKTDSKREKKIELNPHGVSIKGYDVIDGYLERLRKDAKKYQSAGVKEQVLLCFSTDPYHPGDVEPTRTTLTILAEHGLAFCTLTKGGSKALRDIELFRPARDAFACTLTTLDERRAALPADRIETLRRFHERGVFTWVSLEPTLDIEAVSLSSKRRTALLISTRSDARTILKKLPVPQTGAAIR